MKSKFVSIISPQYGTAGTDLNYYKIAQNLSSRGHKIKLLIIGDEWNDKHTSDNLDKIYLINRRVFSILKNKFFHWKITMILAIIFSTIPFLIYLYKNKNSSYLLGLFPIFPLIIFFLLRFKNIIVFSIQGLPRSNLFTINLFFSKLIKNVKCVIPNESMKNYLDKKYRISKNIHYDVVSNAVLDQNIIIQSNEEIIDDWYADRKLKKIIAVGRLTYQKNFDNLLKSFRTVFEFDSSARLIIIGDGEDFNLLNNLKKKLELENSVKFLGYKKNPFKYIKNSDLFVMNSRWEGPGHVLIEAMGVGCPVITTDCDSGPADTIKNGEYGLLIKPDDSNQLSQSMIYALKNKQEMILKLKKAKLFLNRFYTQEVADRYLQLFNT
tara:strand:+ start:1308 stop:2447 length:1140 start_codon:yes stop_codon:yes gene_type:complete